MVARSIRAACGWRSTIEPVGVGSHGEIYREKAAIFFEVDRNCDWLRAFSLRTEKTEILAMNDTSQFATAMIALVFTAALIVTGQRFIEQRVERDIVYATSHLLRPL
ncbi:hypothetical protein QA641_25870 [Bradyrhizobium sp. CB1650]|uniref:hypothetical protein n=1 Tax=Bradyrhizobium sp. CB1650 TaxID=3039153 RepID=UPI00243491F6|nr:hypothetical protein [Bradyrhizobium sp. CB1650]WGD49064.1 hypothetical protein QA641_25870 [Bradyrhizobium sp. CB1650]